jgi:hypothetical protein
MSRKAMKGQLIFEFVIATLFFLAIVMYTMNYLNLTVFSYSESHYNSMLHNNAWQASEALVTGKGVWSGASPNMVPQELGIAESWPVLSFGKIASLDNWCQVRLDEMAALLDVDPELHGASVKIYRKTAAGENVIAECGSVPSRLPHSEVTRFGVLDTDSSLVKVVLWYW